jgi:hypothetical protein
MASNNYKAALASVRAIQEGERLAALESGSASLFTMAERERDRIRAEKMLEKQQRKLAIANTVGTVAAVGGAFLGGPQVGAAAGGVVTMGGRRLAQGGWKNKVEGLTFAASRDSLRQMTRPDMTKDLAVSLNAAATGYQAGKLMDTTAVASGPNQILNSDAFGENTKELVSMSRPEDYTRKMNRIVFNDAAARQRLRSQYKSRDRKPPSWLDDTDNQSFELPLILRDIVKGRF